MKSYWPIKINVSILIFFSRSQWKFRYSWECFGSLQWRHSCINKYQNSNSYISINSYPSHKKVQTAFRINEECCKIYSYIPILASSAASSAPSNHFPKKASPPIMASNKEIGAAQKAGFLSSISNIKSPCCFILIPSSGPPMSYECDKGCSCNGKKVEGVNGEQEN